MLKLRDFLHLPQLDSLVEKLIADEPAMIVLAGIHARTPLNDHKQEGGMFMASGMSAIFNIMMQEILLAHPLCTAIVVSADRSMARVPRQLSRRVHWVEVAPPYTYEQQITQAMRQGPGLLVIDHLTAESAPAAFRAARNGLRVLVQLDTVLRGASVAHQVLDLGVPREHLAALRWVLTTQRMSVLCERCRRPVALDEALVERICSRYPRLRPVCDQLRVPERGQPKTQFFRAGSCDICHNSGYQGDITLFDLFHNQPGAEDFFAQPSLLSLEEYALRLAAQGRLDMEDVLDLENDHLRRTYQMLTSSERALTQTNAELNRKLFELEASNRVLVQRTEVLMSLQDLGQLLISSSDLSELAARVCRRAGDLLGAEYVVLYLRRMVENREAAEILAVRGWSQELAGKHISADQVFLFGDSRRSSRFVQLPPGVDPAMAEYLPSVPSTGGKGSVATAGLRLPLYAQDQLVGVMILQSTRKEFFTPGEMALLQTFANQAALAIQRAGLVEELRAKILQLEEAQAGLVKKERMERELELAREVQQSMLPQSFPEVPGFGVSARNQPARQVGGDFYDMLVLDDDHFGIVIADVADKGMPAALYMALSRSLLLAEARRERSPEATLRNVNRLLLEVGDLNGFVSVFFAVVERSTRKMVYTRAGHERPLLLRRGSVRALGGEGVVLGILESEALNLTEEEEILEPGDRLVLFTDGLTDVVDEHGVFLGLERMSVLVQDRAVLPADDFCRNLFDALVEFRGSVEQFDDMTLLVLEVM